MLRMLFWVTAIGIVGMFLGGHAGGVIGGAIGFAIGMNGRN